MELSRTPHGEVRGRFGALVDGELDAASRAQLEGHLAGCSPCQRSWQRYAGAVERVRQVERERAPLHLPSLILRRVRRRGFAARVATLHHQNRVPAELAVLLLVAAAAGALLWLLHP